MRFLVQRVTRASVSVDNEVLGAIDQGFLVLIGISDTDDEAVADKMIRKLLGLRIFEDAEGKTNLNLASVGGNLLLISQFTLYANCKKGNRPSFIKAGEPTRAEQLYEYIIEQCKKEVPDVQRGSFGAYMDIDLVNSGPFTVLLDSEELF